AGQLHGKDVTIDDDSASGAIFASHNVKIEDRAAVSGSINADHDVELKKNSIISGDVTYGKNIKKGKSVSVAGIVAKGSSVAPTAPNTILSVPGDWLASPYATPAFAYGGSNVSVSAADDVTLAAGTYRDLSAGRGARLTLTAGVYNFADISLGQSVRITADTTAGDVVINSADDFNIGSDGIVARLGNGDIIVSSGDDLNIGRNANIICQYRAYDDLSTGNFATVGGTLRAAEDL
ncbi:MAG: hypothetical protein QGG25_17725, partial [Phycisphaerae bacterium]|nr:hypothetical protein [Phycisphaerae bacterium]